MTPLPIFKYGVVFLSCLILWAGQAIGQVLEKKISITVKNVSLENTLQKISEASGVMFSYNPKTIPVSQLITIKAKNKSVQQLLDELSNKAGITYSLVENQVILKAAKKNEVTEVIPAKPRSWVISGTLRDKSNGEILIGANAYAKGSTMGSSTNAYGFYSLRLPEGSYRLAFSFVGYSPVEMDIDLKQDMQLSPDLEPAKMDIQAVEIKAEDEEAALQNGRLTIAKIQPRQLEQMPGIAGDIDIIKSLQAIPGIKSFGDGSALFYTRGGKSDQNLILVDEAPIYNPAHLFGFVSAIAPEAIKEISVYKGDAPAHLGGRLSSVIDIKTRDGSNKKFGFAGNLGLFVSDLAIEGPFARDRASWILAGRISNENWLFSNKLVNRSIKMNFFDINSKLNFKLNKNNRLFVSFFSGKDVFARASTVSGKTFGINWDNLLGTMRWNHIFNDKLFSNTTLYYSRYNYYLYVDKESGDYWKSSVVNAGFKTDFTWYLNASNTLRSGIEISPFRSDPGNINLSDISLLNYIKKTSRYKSATYSLYFSNEQTLGKKFKLNYGIRLPLWQNYGWERQFIFDENYNVVDTLRPEKNSVYSTFFRAEPRIVGSWVPGKHNILRLTYARSYQFIQLLNNSTSPFTSLEPWVPAGPNIKPQRSDLYALAYIHELKSAMYLFSAEGYFRDFRNTIDYCDHSNLLYNPLLEGELRFGRSWAYGIELLIRKAEGHFTGWLAYTYSRAYSKINGLNNGRTFAASFDTPHELSVNLNYDTYKRWVFTINWVYHTGSPISTPTSFYYYQGSLVPYYGEKNNDRLPDYHRLDLSILLRLSKPYRKYQHSLSLNIFNLYSHKNPFSVNVNKFIDSNGNFVVPTNASGDYEHIPTVISAAGIIPSINYKFRF